MGKLDRHLPRRRTRPPRQTTPLPLRIWARLHLPTIHQRLLRSALHLQRRPHRLSTARLLQCTVRRVPPTVAEVASTSNHLRLQITLLPPQASARRVRPHQPVHHTLRPVPCTTAVPLQGVRVLGRHTLPQVHSTRLTVLSTLQRKLLGILAAIQWLTSFIVHRKMIEITDMAPFTRSLYYHIWPHFSRQKISCIRRHAQVDPFS